jgi:phosphate transport system substrate-binding protein
VAAAASLLALVVASCGGTEGADAPRPRQLTPAAATDQAELSGSGSTLVEPLLKAWTDRYKDVAPGVTIDYESIGSGEALDRLTSGPGDFFASDVPIDEAEAIALGGPDEVLQIPWAAAAITVAYNLPGVDSLQLDPETLAGIFSGRVQRWDDASIRGDNPGVHLPSQVIQVYFRSDASGTSDVFTSYLSAAGPGSWHAGSGLDVDFPRGSGVRGANGMAAAVAKTSGSIGYVDLNHARQAGVGVALLANRADRYVGPTPDGVNAALAGADARSPAGGATLLFTPESPGAYPLATVTYLVFRRKGLDPAKAAAVRHFAEWVLTDGQRLAGQLGYVRVPPQLGIPALSVVRQPQPAATP